MARVIRLTEQEFSGLLGDILKMTLSGGIKKKDNQDSDMEDNSTDDESNDQPIGKVSAKGQELLNNPMFKEKLKEISNEIGVRENSIIKLMKHESGLNPSIKNPIGCVGLIQFCPDSRGGSSKTINGKTYKLSELQNDLELQLEAIKEFWSRGKRDGKIKSAEDLYIYNFFPVAAGKSDDFVLQAKGLSAEKVAKANPIFNRVLGKKNNQLTVSDLKQYYQKTGMV